MSEIIEEVTAQLVDELGSVARAVTDVLGTDLAVAVETRLEARCRMLAAELCSDDDHLAAEATLSVMVVLFPGQCEPPHEWWRTPVGRMVARSVGHDDAEAVTRSVAAAMLGVHPGTVAQLTSRGKLLRHPDGGITRASVLDRIARARPRPDPVQDQVAPP